MCVCVYACVYACVWVCLCMCMYTCVCVCMYECVCEYACVCVYIYTGVYVYVQAGLRDIASLVPDHCNKVTGNLFAGEGSYLQCVQHATSVKHHKAECSKKRCACMHICITWWGWRGKRLFHFCFFHGGIFRIALLPWFWNLSCGPLLSPMLYLPPVQSQKASRGLRLASKVCCSVSFNSSTA